MLLNKKKCPLCNKSKIKFSYTSIKDKIDYSNCKNCGLYNLDTSFPYFKTPYQNLKRDIKSLKKIQSVKNSPPYVGNMLNMVFKKI